MKRPLRAVSVIATTLLIVLISSASAISTENPCVALNAVIAAPNGDGFASIKGARDPNDDSGTMFLAGLPLPGFSDDDCNVMNDDVGRATTYGCGKSFKDTSRHPNRNAGAEAKSLADSFISCLDADSRLMPKGSGPSSKYDGKEKEWAYTSKEPANGGWKLVVRVDLGNWRERSGGTEATVHVWVNLR